MMMDFRTKDPNGPHATVEADGQLSIPAQLAVLHHLQRPDSGNVIGFHPKSPHYDIGY
jgi:hypothetical protein